LPIQNMMEKTTTPRTDKHATPIIGFYTCETVPASLARELETELTHALAQLRAQESPQPDVWDWIGIPPKDEHEREAKEWLTRYLRPAYDKIADGTDKWLDARVVTCRWRDGRYRCVGASRLGDVWLRDEGSTRYYDHRVDVSQLSDWICEECP